MLMDRPSPAAGDVGAGHMVAEPRVPYGTGAPGVHLPLHHGHGSYPTLYGPTFGIPDSPSGVIYEGKHIRRAAKHTKELIKSTAPQAEKTCMRGACKGGGGVVWATPESVISSSKRECE